MLLLPQRKSSISKSSSTTTLRAAKDPLKRLFTWTDKDDEILKELDRRATELKRKTEKAVRQFDDLVTDAIVTRSAQLIEEIAVEVVKMLSGEWDLSILTIARAENVSSTAEIMDGNVAELAKLSSTLLGRDATSDQLKDTRLRARTDFDVASYPPRLQIRFSMENAQVIELYGQLQFDLVLKNVAFTMDELTVLDVPIDLNSTVMKEAAAAGEASVAEEEEDTPQSTDDEVSSDEKDDKFSLWKRIKSFFKRIVKAVLPAENDEDDEKPETTPAAASNDDTTAEALEATTTSSDDDGDDDDGNSNSTGSLEEDNTTD